VAIVWTAEKLDRTLAIVLGVLALGVVGFVIWLRYRDDEL
jgi:preprotein translocase subunit Sss1